MGAWSEDGGSQGSNPDITQQMIGQNTLARQKNSDFTVWFPSHS